MRRLIFISAFSLLLFVPLWAQRGGGHAGGGHIGGGGHVGGGGHIGGGGHAGGFGGHIGGGHFGGGAHIGGMRSRRPGLSRGALHSFRGSFLHNRFRDHDRDHDRFFFRDRDRFFFRNRPWGWWWWGYDPWLWNWWDDHSSDNSDYYNNLAIANQMNEQSLEQQRMWRQEQADGDQDAYTPRSQPGPSSSNQDSDDKTSTPVVPATVLVFRDGHKQEIQNYAIVGQTLWEFAPQRTAKVSLADLDIDATAKANDQRGVTFRVPASNEAQ